MLLIHFYERTDKMRLIYADYNPLTNSIDVTTFENYILRIDCNKAEDGLKTTPCSQNSLNALAIHDKRMKDDSVRCQQKNSSCDTLRFLLGSCIYDPPFAKTRLRLRQFARWWKLARTSLRKPRYRHFVTVFCCTAVLRFSTICFSCVSRVLSRIPIDYTTLF